MNDRERLQKLIDEAKAKKFREGEAKGLISEIQKEQTKTLLPVMEEIFTKGTERMVSAFERAVRAIQINIPDIQSPEIKLPSFPEFPRIPQIPAPVVNYTPPAIRIPDISMPDKMEISGWVNLMGYDRGLLINPLPVQLRDAKGSPLNLLENLTQVLRGVASNQSGGAPLGSMVGGGKGDYFTVKGIQNSVAATLIDSSGQGYSGSNPLPVTVTSGGNATSASSVVDSSGVAYEGSNPFPFILAGNSSFTLSASLVDSSGVGYSGSNPVPVAVISEAINLDQTTDSIAVRQVSGFTDSVYATNPVDNGDSATALRVVLAGNSAASVSASQVGTWNVQVQDGQASTLTSHQFNNDFRGLDVYVGGIFSTLGATLVDSGGNAYSGSNPTPVVLAAGSNNTVAAMSVDSSGIGYSGSNPLPITLISGALTSSIAVGPSSIGTADDGSAPLQQGGIARTANPVAVSGGQVVKASFDKIGRQLVRPLQVRDLIQTAYATLTNGTETTLLAGIAATFLDLIYITGANNSDAAVIVDLRAGTANGIVMSLTIPANGTAGVSLAGSPLPQDVAANTWTADMPDITGTTVYLSALFSKEL